jgi:alpha/beta hydrolase fold
MAATKASAGDVSLHDLRPVEIYQPLHNSLPPQLVSRFDPVYVEHYNKFNAGRLCIFEVPIEELRKRPFKYVISYGRAAGPDVYRITEQKCPVDGGEITIRIFEPAPIFDEKGNPKKRGAYISFHGGGWVMGGLASEHDLCKRIVNSLDGGVVAFDVDYRLAPEHKYPVPVNDSWAAFNWVSHCLF